MRVNGGPVFELGGLQERMTGTLTIIYVAASRPPMRCFQAVGTCGRDWQTRRTQNPLVARPCGFDSLLRHQFLSFCIGFVAEWQKRRTQTKLGCQMASSTALTCEDF